MMEGTVLQKAEKKVLPEKPVCVTIHHAADGPSMEACMVAILKAHMTETQDF